MTTISIDDGLHNFTTIWNHVECGIVIVDATTREILDINPVAARMVGDDPSKIVGKRCHKFICPAEVNACPIMDKGQIVDRSERKFIRANGESVPIIKSVAKIQYRGRLALLESFTDIGNLKEAEAKLLQFRVAEQANQAKSDFLSRMSHEMRTPMNAIIGMTKISKGTDDVSRLKYCLSQIEVSASHLLGLINDVLDMSKIEAGKLELDNVPLNIEDILKKICGLVIEQMEEKGIRFHLEINKHMDMRFRGDELRISQVIANLMSNAVKFTPSGGRITLFAEEVERRETTSLLRFRVEDTGIGMTADQIGMLFSAFEQTDKSISRRYGGTGLGLSISKSIIEKMNGTVEVVSTPGKGSVFTATMDLERMPLKVGQSSACGRVLSGLRVLVIDPDAYGRNSFSFLRECGDNVVDELNDARNACDLVAKAARDGKPYDAVFVAHMLSDMTCLDLMGECAAASSPSRWIMLAAFSEWTNIEADARAVGLDKFLPKPLFPSDILDMLETLVHRNCPLQEKHDEIPDFSDITILLAEDVAINREIFAALLEKTDVHIDFAENGVEAVAKFKSDPRRYNCIIMDVQMPEMDGYEATEAIRALDCERAAKIPIIAMTANVFTDDIKRCLDSGMNDHMAKPIDEKAVMQKIHLHCKLA